jgi:hypothetical protein
MSRRKTIAVLAISSLALAAAPAFAAKGGGGGGNKVSDPPCTASGNIVEASALPTDEVINFMMSDASGSTGWVLGYTPDGTWKVDVPAPNGPTTYQFISRTWGNGGNHYTVFSSCSA